MQHHLHVCEDLVTISAPAFLLYFRPKPICIAIPKFWQKGMLVHGARGESTIKIIDYCGSNHIWVPNFQRCRITKSFLLNRQEQRQQKLQFLYRFEHLVLLSEHRELFLRCFCHLLV